MTSCFLLVCLLLDDSPRKESTLTLSEQKAVAKYDYLEDKWKTKCVDAWKDAYRKSKKNSKLLKNDPPYYPPLFHTSGLIDELIITNDSWGHLINRANINGPGVWVVNVVDKNRVLCKCGELFFVDGADTSKIVDNEMFEFPGAYYVSGTATYKTVNGGKNTIRVLSPLPTKDDKQKK